MHKGFPAPPRNIHIPTETQALDGVMEIDYKPIQCRSQENTLEVLVGFFFLFFFPQGFLGFVFVGFLVGFFVCLFVSFVCLGFCCYWFCLFVCWGVWGGFLGFLVFEFWGFFPLFMLGRSGPWSVYPMRWREFSLLCAEVQWQTLNTWIR